MWGVNVITINDFQRIIADALFSGDMAITGLILFCTVLGFIFIVFRRQMFAAVMISLPSTLVFSTLGVLTSEFTMLILVVEVLVLAISVKDKVAT